jgi:hypothetical protein
MMMFEIIKEAVLARLGIADTEVAETREHVAKEAEDEAVRKAREHQLEHPDGYSTPLAEAVRRAENKAAKLRTEADALAKPFAVAALAADAAEASLERVRRAKQDKLDLERKRSVSGMYANAEEFIARLHQHRVNHWHLTQMRTVEVAMIADLIMWKSFDPTHRLPGSPWRSVLKCYASRSLYKDGPRPWSEPEPPPPKPGAKELWKKWPYYDTAEVYAKLLGGAFTAQSSPPPPDQEPIPHMVSGLKPLAAPVTPTGSSNSQSLPSASGQPKVRSTIANRIAQKHATQLAISRSVTPKEISHDDE